VINDIIITQHVRAHILTLIGSQSMPTHQLVGFMQCICCYWMSWITC